MKRLKRRRSGSSSTLWTSDIACAYLATPFARRITGGTVYVDGGANLIA